MHVPKTPAVLCALAVALGGASYAVTDVGQKGRIERLRDSRRAAELMTARVEDLLAEESTSTEAAGLALSRWHSRYKYIPREMTTADIVEYLEGLTRTGFEAFDLKLAGREETPDFNKYTFEVQGEGRYTALYHLVWHLENNREFYRVSDLRMEHLDGDAATGRGGDRVKFSFGLEAFFGGIEGISAPEEGLAPIPVDLLLPHETDSDIFYPMVRVPRGAPSTPVSGPEIGGGPTAAAPSSPSAPSPAPTEAPRAAEARAPQAPPIERATLLFIVGSQAVFDDGTGAQVTARVGDAVFGGELTTIDPDRGAVRIRIEEDGRARVVVLTLGAGPARR